MSDDIDRYAVFGHPVAHSQSPLIHTLFAQQTGQQLVYTAVPVEPGHFSEAVDDFARHNGRGINVTVPFKQEAWQLAHSLSARARRAGAVNTLVLNRNGQHFGDNTDGVGLVTDLVDNNHTVIQGRRVLIIGAGGAVRGVLEPLIEQNPQALVIANRTREKAVQLEQDFSDSGRVTGCGLDELNEQRFDIVINGTSASLHGGIPALPQTLFNDNAVCYDMMYAARPTPFMQWAGSLGVSKTLDGLGMLVEQAAESFYIWRKVRPDTTPVIESVRAELS